MIYLFAAIGVLLLILAFLVWYIARQSERHSHLRAIYTNGDGGGLGTHASIAEWERLAQASLNASRARRKNGVGHG